MKNIFSTFFGNISEGKITRKTFIIYLISLCLILIAFGLLTISGISGAESLIGGNLQEAQDKIREAFSVPYLIIFAIFTAGILYSRLVLIIKRLRDTGLKGALLFIATFFTYTIGFFIIVAMCIPTDYFKKDK